MLLLNKESTEDVTTDKLIDLLGSHLGLLLYFYKSDFGCRFLNELEAYTLDVAELSSERKFSLKVVEALLLIVGGIRLQTLADRIFISSFII